MSPDAALVHPAGLCAAAIIGTALIEFVESGEQRKDIVGLCAMQRKTSILILCCLPMAGGRRDGNEKGK